MNTFDRQYLKLANEILKFGTTKENRTGINTLSFTGSMLRHDMREGFPALTTKKVAFKTAAVELEGFMKGITDKQWYKDRKCNIWNEWCNPLKIAGRYTNDEERKQLQLIENDLGPIYGAQGRSFGGQGYDQLTRVIETLKNNPSDRRMLVSYWNPYDLEKQALPPCHFAWQVVVRGRFLDLVWYQRSADVFIGVPFDAVHYGLLLSLLARQFAYIPGMLTGFFADTHIYENHIAQIKLQMTRVPKHLPRLNIKPTFKDIRAFEHSDIELCDYNPHPAIKAEVAI